VISRGFGFLSSALIIFCSSGMKRVKALEFGKAEKVEKV